MEEKFSVLDILRSRRGFIGPTCQYVSRSEDKHYKHSNFGTATASCSPRKEKNILILPKTTTKIIKLFENLSVEEIVNSRPNLPDVKVKRKRFYTNKKCKTMDSSEHSTKINNVEDIKVMHSSNTNHSKNEPLIDLNSSKEKTEEFKSKDLHSRRPKLGKAVLKKLCSEEEINSFEEFDPSAINDPNNEVQTNIIQNIPVTVQEWVNHLPSKDVKDDLACVEINAPNENVQVLQHSPIVESTALLPAKLSREASLQSSSSLESLLDARKPDPVEIFLNLGFGGVPGVDMENCRIPKRFLVPSKCKGGDWNEFLRRELIQAQNFECSSLGFRGLSGPSYRRPSAIVANIMEKLRERSIPQSNRSKSLAILKKGSSEKCNQSKLSPEFQSVLSPDNRKFLQNQGKISPEVPRRRIIFGQKSFAFAHNGEFVEVESPKEPVDSKINQPPVPGVLTENGNRKAENSLTENLVKFRRSSLQKQKKIVDDFDVDCVFGLSDGECQSDNNNEVPSLESISKCPKESFKIPTRFLSSSTLKSFDTESSLSENIRKEVEKEILSLSKKIKDISDQELASVLRQVKQLSSALENNPSASFQM